MAIQNYDAWLKVMVRDADGNFDYQATKAVLKTVCELQKADEDRILACVLEVMKECHLHSHLTKPVLQCAVKQRLAPNDMMAWPELDARSAEVIARHFKIERKSGVMNPHYAPPPPNSRQAIAAGNAR
jgi:hypothetical protein